MNDTRDINGTPTDSEKMDISEVSDIISPTSDQSLCEMVDNAGTTSGFTSCESHPLDNAPELATSSRMTTTSLETSTSQVSNSMEQIPLDADSSLRSFNGESPAESDDDPSSVYAARVADDYQDVRLRKDRAGSQTANQSGGRRRIRLSPSLLRDEAESSDESVGADLDTLADSGDELEDSILERLGGAAPEPIPELSAAEELADERAWRTCRLAGTDRAIDMKVIEPYKRVLSHGGYLAAGARNAIVVFSACFLPDRSRTDYDYVMDNLFFYVVHTLQRLVTQDYVLVYLHGGAQRSCMPTFSWLKRCYHMLDRRLRKDLKALYLVHPTFWLKTLVLMTRPFVSSKFSRKLSFVGSLEELRCILPLEQASIPDRVKQVDASLG